MPISFLKNILKRTSPILLVVITLSILVLTLMPAKVLSQSKLFSYDKIGHLGIFFIWTYLYGFTVRTRKWPLPSSNLVIFIAGAFFGLAIEFFQLILPINRAFELGDWVADILGCGIAVSLLMFTVKESKEINAQTSQI